MKTWLIEVNYGNVTPTYVAKQKLDLWRKVLFQSGFKFEPMRQCKNMTVEWRVSHYENDHALEELLFIHGDKLLPATFKEMENV